MAIEAGRHISEDSVALRIADVAKPPVDQVNGIGRQWLHSAVGIGRGHERHIAIEDGGAHWVSRSGEGDVRLGDSDVAIAIARDGERGGMLF